MNTRNNKYEAPTLTTYGDLKNLTKGSGGSNDDGDNLLKAGE